MDLASAGVAPGPPWVPADLDAPGVGPPRSGGKIVLRGHPRRGKRIRVGQGVLPPVQKGRVIPRVTPLLPPGGPVPRLVPPFRKVLLLFLARETLISS